MRKYLHLLVVLTLAAAFNSTARADDDGATIKVSKATDTMAKVSFVPEKGKPMMVPVMFDSGASWDDVKDTYTVTPETAKGIEHKKVALSFGTDGTLSFHSKKK